MSISDSLAALRGVRDAIRDAIVGKGGSLPPGSPMGSYATAITNLPSGSGGDTEIPFRSRLTIPGDTDPWHLTHLTATQVPNYAFQQDTALTTVSLPLVTSIGAGAFQSCTSLTSVDFPAATIISTSAFNGCSALTTVDFPVVTSISSYAFQSCTSLTTADFPLVTIINSYVFRDCTALTSLTLTKMATLSSTNAFQGTPIASGTGYIYVPDDLVDQYKAATNWKTYANQIMPLSQKP